MNENAAVANICRNRPRSKQHRIVGNRIVGVGEPELIALDAVNEDESGGVRIELRINKAVHAALRTIAKSQGRSVSSTLSRYIAQTISFLAKKVAANGTNDRR